MTSLPPWSTADLPEPQPFSARNLSKSAAPGPSSWHLPSPCSYGPGLLWIATSVIGLQLLFNLEAIRYTLYTGEPIITGFAPAAGLAILGGPRSRSCAWRS